MPVQSGFLLLTLAWPALLQAQEIKYIDVSTVRPRTELRNPLAAQSECKEVPNCFGVGSGYGIGSVTDGAPKKWARPAYPGIYLLRSLRSEINSTEPFQS